MQLHHLFLPPYSCLSAIYLPFIPSSLFSVFQFNLPSLPFSLCPFPSVLYHLHLPSSPSLRLSFLIFSLSVQPYFLPFSLPLHIQPSFPPLPPFLSSLHLPPFQSSISALLSSLLSTPSLSSPIFTSNFAFPYSTLHLYIWSEEGLFHSLVTPFIMISTTDAEVTS